ncbi:MAG: radical SAM family heme chaperone HemW [Pseudomonadota bacterium]
MSTKTEGGFGLYIHWPFCQAKCPYCDFNSHVWSDIDHEAWTDAYLVEIDRVAEFTNTRVLDSVYFGGGTPSLMTPGSVDQILRRIQARWSLANDIEITLEANPTSIELERFVGFRSAGVNRVSVGVQALNNRDLSLLGRLHSVEDALKSLEIARTIFDRSSFDLIYARQHQGLSDWQAELDACLSFEPTHLSLYQLTIEDGTAFGDRYKRGKLPALPGESLAVELFEATQEMTAAAGLPAYEISNHASDNDRSRHNLIYWRGGDYLGIGPGAHGRYIEDGQRVATETYLSPAEWLSSVRVQKSGESERFVITNREQAIEYLLMALRLREGMDLSRLNKMDPTVLNANRANELQAEGKLSVIGTRMYVPDSARLLLNKIIEEIII